ncbi:PREDICTED: MATH domain and coiled-coil domain-containing protein At2g42480-like [Brassica oleracea var. oleracea]|uniref:MATH domain and coiled-coil domain-containing protein At2g42480-like n=1 Tax=Brassica oleracea var. oleracea TaxID=109376 RepID=UPI0006A74CFF|nr:PREDICTED: MATH domain and coiled-coil domain-containing protein At2g42480-like [Brassica oleracea var. oleracea]
MWNQKPSFRFEIDNYSEKPSIQIQSKTFVAGGCEWYLNAFPKGGYLADHDHFSLFLQVANRTMLPTGWKRKVSFYFTLLNQSDKELCRSKIVRCQVLDVKGPSWGFEKLCPLSKLQENGVLEKDRLIIEVYINLIEAVDGESGEVPEKHETVDMNGLKVLASQVTLVRKIFAEHPDIALGFKSKNQVLKTAYMNVLIGLINTLNKPSHNHSEAELTKADSELSELEEVGFKLDWLKLKLEDVILERKKADVYGNKVIQLEERMKNLEQMENKMKRSIVECFLERKKAKDDGSRVKTLEERVNNLEVVDSSFRMDCLKSKFGGVSLEKKKVDDADASRVQQLEENLKNLEEIVSDLKVKLDQGKEKNSCDGFLLVDEDEVA